MKRREFITLVGSGIAAWPLTARAQQPDQVRRIGVLFSVSESDPEGQAWLSAFREGASAARLDGWPQHPARLSLGVTARSGDATTSG